MLRIFLYSAIIIGCFANFARNEWGMNLRGYAELLLGLTFIFELISNAKKRNLKIQKGTHILSQIERVFIFLLFAGYFFKVMHWPGAGITIVFSSLFLIIISLIRLFAQPFKHKINFSFNITFTFFFIAIILLIAGVVFKTMHWPMGSLIILSGFILFVVVSIIGITIKKSTNDNMNIREYISINFSPSHFLFFYFGVWSIYITLAQYQLAPKFYTSQNPYVFEKLLEENKTEEADLIHDSYGQLIEFIQTQE